MRLHQMRHKTLDWKQGKRCGRNSRIVTWRKPVYPKDRGFTREQWAKPPEQIEVRLVRKSFTDRYRCKSELVIVSSLLDRTKHSSEELAAIYLRRWEIEVRLGDVKEMAAGRTLSKRGSCEARSQ